MRIAPWIFLLAYAAPLSAQAVQSWQGRVDLAIGGPDETRDPYIFDVIGGLAFDPAGRIVVALPKENAIRLFSPAGQYLFGYGRKGAGPGDLNYPCCIAFDDAGRLWIREMGNRRHSIVAITDGGPKFVTSYPIAGGAGGSLERLNWDQRGAPLYQTTESRGGPMRTVRFHVDSTGKEFRRDTLRDSPIDSSTRVSITRKIPGGVSISWTVVAFAPRHLRAEGPGGQLAETTSGVYEVEWFDGSLRPLRTLRADFAPPALTARERSAARDSIAEFAVQMKAEVDLDAVKIPTRKPAIASLGFDLDGRLWVERSVADGQPREADVYDPQGTLVARATWPADVLLRYHAIRGNTALGIRTGDEPSIVRLVFSH